MAGETGVQVWLGLDELRQRFFFLEVHFWVVAHANVR